MAKPAPLLVDPNSPAFSDTHAAARAIGNNFSDKGGEQAAAIIKGTDGQYRYTTSVPGTQDNFSMHVGLRQGESLAGIMHSHPGTDNDAKVFSPNDIDTANQLKVPSYVQFSGQNNAIRMYTPGVTKTRSVPSQGYQAGNMQVADGDPLPAPPKSMPTAPDQDIPPSAPPVAVTPVQGSQVSANDEFAGFSPADEFAGFAAAPTSGATADFSDDDSPEAAEAKGLAAGTQALAHTAAAGIAGLLGKGYGYLQESAARALGNDESGIDPEKTAAAAAAAVPGAPAQGSAAAGAENVMGQAMGKVGAGVNAAGRWLTEPTADMWAHPEKYGYKNKQELQDEVTAERGIGFAAGETANIAGAAAAPFQIAHAGIGAMRGLAAPEEATVLGGIRAASPPDHPAGVTRADYAPKAPEAAPAPPAAAIPPSATPARVPVPGKPHITPKATEQVAPTAAAAAEHIRAQEGEMGVAGAPEPPAAAAPPPAAAAPPPAAAAPPPAAAAPPPAAAPSPATPSAAPGPHGNPPPASIHDPDFFTPPDNQDLKSAPAGPQEQAARQAAVERGAPTLPQVRDSAITNDYAAQGRDWTGKQSGDPAATAQVAAEGQALHSEASRISQNTGGQIGTGEAADRVRGQAYQDWHDTTVNALKGHIDNAYAAEDAQARQIATPGSNLKGILTDDSLIDSANAGSARSSTIALGKKMGVDLTDPNATMNAYQVEQLRKHAGSIYGNAPRFAQAIKNAADADLPQGAYVQARALNKLKSDMFDNRDGINQLGASKDIDPNTGKPRPENRPVKAGDVMSTIEGMDPEQIAHIGRTMKRSSSVLKALGDDAAAENITDKAYKAAQNLQSHFTERWNEEAAKGGGWNTRRANSFLRDNQEKLAATFSPDQMHQMRNVNSAAHVLDLDKRYKGAFAQFRSGASWLRQRLGRTAEGVMTDLIPMGNTLGEMTGLSEKARNFLGGANKAEVPKGFTRPLGQRMPGQGGWIGDRTAGAEPGGKQNIVAPKGITHEYDPEEGTHTVTSANGTTHAYDQGNDIRVNETNTTGGGGKGEGTARMAQLAETAHARGGKLISDPTVSAPQSHIYEEKLGKERGYNVERNPNATPSTSEAGGWVSDAPNKPVFTVGPRRVGGVPQAGAVPGETTPMGRSIFGGRQAGAVGDLTRRPQGGNPYESAGSPYNTAPVQRDVWGNERAKQDRSTPAGARLFGGKQRGAVGTLNKVEEPGATLNIGLHQGTEGQPGFRKMSKQEVTAAIKAQGVGVGKTSIQTGGDEPTLVADINRPLTAAEGNTLAKKTGQTAIAQRHADGTGTMLGEGAQSAEAKQNGWDKYNPDYFREHNGKTATENATQGLTGHGDTGKFDKPKQRGAVGNLNANKSFKSWFGKSQVVDPLGNPLKVYHGTTNDFKSFDTERANPESDFGRGIYFTNDKDDVRHNYAGEGPDLKNKIENRAEQLAAEHGLDIGQPEESDKLYAQAAKEYKAHEGMTIPAYLRMENPVVLGGKNETRLSHEYEYEDDDPEKNIIGEKGTLPEFTQHLRNAATSGYYHGIDDSKLSDAISQMHEHGDGLKISDAIKMLRDQEGALTYAMDDSGKMAGNEIVRDALERAGYDGIIDRTVNKKFGSEIRLGKPMEGMKPNTVHYIIFHPNQIKSAIGNSGKFSRTNPDITAQNQRNENGVPA